MPERGTALRRPGFLTVGSPDGDHVQILTDAATHLGPVLGCSAGIVAGTGGVGEDGRRKRPRRRSAASVTPAPAAYALAGEVDASTAPFHLERLQTMIRASASDHVVIELAQTRMVDTTGLGMLINARKTASDLGKRLVLRGANHRLVRLMEIAGTHPLFDWEP